MRTAFLILLSILGMQAFAASMCDSPTCESISGYVYCGYNCTQISGYVYCGTSPGQTCSNISGAVYCGANCKTISGYVYCGDNGLGHPATPARPAH